MTTDVYFVGAGARNVVFGAPMIWLYWLTQTPEPAPSEDRTADSYHVALRFSKSPVAECETCLKALQRFTGPHIRVTLDVANSRHAALVERVASLAPPQHRQYLQACTEVVLLPNFLAPARLAQSRCGPHHASGSRGDPLWTLEVKPKATWRPPVVAGIRIGTVTHLLHRAKRAQCRFSLHEHHRLGGSHLPDAHGRLRYCPTQFYHATQSTVAALEQLTARENKYFRFLPSVGDRQCNTADGAGPSPGREDSRLSGDERHRLAEVLDTSGVWAALEHTQRYGTAVPTLSETVLSQPTDDSVRTVHNPVLDIELLYPWFEAAQEAGGADKLDVQWLHDDSVDETTTCVCTSRVEAAGTPPLPYVEERLRAAPPAMTLDACIENFYVSTTAKDVSILVTALAPQTCDSPIQSDARESTTACCRGMATAASLVTAGVLVSSSGSDRIYRVGIVDVDDKRIKSLRHYYQQDQVILSSWDEKR